MANAIKLKNNTYIDSSSIVDNRTKLSDILNVTSVSLTPINTTNFSGTFTIKKIGKVVTLETANFVINSLSANTWTDVLNIPDAFLPSNEVRGAGFCDLLGINAIISSGKKLVINSRTNAVSSKGLYLNMSWIVD